MKILNDMMAIEYLRIGSSLELSKVGEREGGRERKVKIVKWNSNLFFSLFPGIHREIEKL